MQGPRRPALAPAPVRVAIARQNNPTVFIQSHYQKVWRTQMCDMPFVNPALSIETIGFTRHAGDWVGVVVTPWFLNLFLLNGGGSLWQDISAGTRRYVALPCGPLEFIADDDPEAGLIQYCPLIAPVTTLADMASARQAALDALQAVMTAVPPTEPSPVPDAPVPTRSGTPSRRGFMRHLTGRS